MVRCRDREAGGAMDRDRDDNGIPDWQEDENYLDEAPRGAPVGGGGGGCLLGLVSVLGWAAVAAAGLRRPGGACHYLSRVSLRVRRAPQ